MLALNTEFRLRVQPCHALVTGRSARARGGPAPCDRCPPACARRCWPRPSCSPTPASTPRRWRTSRRPPASRRRRSTTTSRARRTSSPSCSTRSSTRSPGPSTAPCGPRAPRPTGCVRSSSPTSGVFEELPGGQPGPAVRPRPSGPDPPHRRADRGRLPRRRCGSCSTRGPRTAASAPVEHPGVMAVAILGAVTTVGINAISLGPTRLGRRVADDVIGFVLRGVRGSDHRGRRRRRLRHRGRGRRRGSGPWRRRGRVGRRRRRPTSRCDITRPGPGRRGGGRDARRVGVPDLVTVTAGIGHARPAARRACRRLGPRGGHQRQGRVAGHARARRPDARGSGGSIVVTSSVSARLADEIDGPLLRVEGRARHGRSGGGARVGPDGAGQRRRARGHRHPDARTGAPRPRAGSAASPTAPPSDASAPPTTWPRPSSPSTTCAGSSGRSSLPTGGCRSTAPSTLSGPTRTDRAGPPARRRSLPQAPGPDDGQLR